MNGQLHNGERLADDSAAGATMADLDPLERHRIREAIARYGGDRSLLGLDDERFDAALGLVQIKDGVRVPTVAGLLLAGKEPALREHLPNHEVAFQVLSGTWVQVNDFYRWPLVRLFERIEEQFRVHVRKEEVQVGFLRVPVPSVAPRAFREALINALVHRDYNRLGAIHVRWNDTELCLSNPGGFVEGVTLDNLLVVEPRPRNPLLADIFKRLGLAERTGRGVDLIFKSSLSHGRPAPDYSRSGRVDVAVTFRTDPVDVGFVALVLEEEQRGPLPAESLLALRLLWEAGRVGPGEVAKAIQKPIAAALDLLERLVAAGLAQAHGQPRSRIYALNPSLAERSVEWQRKWRRGGFEEGVEKSLAAARQLLVQHLEVRFGALPPRALSKLQAIDGVAALFELSFAVPGASSLADLGLE